MKNGDDTNGETGVLERSADRTAVQGQAREGSDPAPVQAAAQPAARAADPASHPAAASPTPAAGAPSYPQRRALIWAMAVAGLAYGGYAVAPTVKTMLETISTDDAYVSGHVTYVAPRVAGQVSRVLVDDNDRVSKGDLLVQLDREPYQVQVDLKKAAVVNAEVDLDAARHRSAASWPRPAASAGSSRRRSKTSTTRSRCCGPVSRPCGARRRASIAPGPSSHAPGVCLRGPRSPVRSSTGTARPSGRPRPLPRRPSKRSTRRGSPSASPRTPTARS